MNTDEAAALGAAYKAAELRHGFKVNKFITKDATMFPIEVSFFISYIMFYTKNFNINSSICSIFSIQLIFNRENKIESEQVRHVLFSYMKPYPLREIITFINQKLDFGFTVGYAELSHLDENEIRSLGSLSLHHIQLKGISNAYSEYQDQESTNRINLHFTMDASGILVLENIEFTIGNSVINDQIEESSLMNILNFMRNFFKG